MSPRCLPASYGVCLRPRGVCLRPHGVHCAIASTVTGYDGLNPLGGDVQIHRAKPKYALYPVWMLTTTYQNKQYRFAMNGQTGKFVGTLPVDKKSLWLYRLLYTGIIGAVVWLVLHFLFGF